MFFNLLIMSSTRLKSKKPPISEEISGFLWQREKDSNPHKQSQSLSCYPYTIPLYIACRLTSAGFIIPKSEHLSIPFFKKLRG
ncbi:hypothetical protein KL86CLO1_11091 [uncultured Eubacteriales bacterium]|uniref:Uncharacterized protein n=1 Tax=uncultured Eubacteriales bacterium TaxID=172733 RepID=A0A212JHU9_9FIRM|nr:hypothetical protein KL86CLO1_11091 [uncultured Eubacteriales bacterium]